MKAGNLFAASRQGDLARVEQLIQNGASTNNRDSAGITPLFHALSEGHLQVVEYLLQNGAWCGLSSNSGLSYVRHAVEKNNVAGLKLLHHYGCDINENFGDTPLHVACRLGHADCVEALVELGADVNARVLMFGFTPLHVAVSKHKNDCVIDVLVKTTDIRAVSTQGLCPVEVAAANNHVYGIHSMARHGWDLNHTSMSGSFPLLKAAETRSLGAFEALLKSGCNVNQLTSLPYSHITGHSDVCSDDIDRYGVLHALSYTDKSSTYVNLILDHHGDVNMGSTVARETPLHIAARSGAVGLVQIYIMRGADCDAEDAEGLTPFSCAILSGQTEVCRAFLAAGEHLQRSGVDMRNGTSVNKIDNDVWLSIQATSYLVTSLMSICRRKIRKSVRPPFVQNIHRLPLPCIIQQFLLMQTTAQIELS